MKKNDIIELKIEDVTLEGSGIGRYEGLAVFVPNSVTGDVLRVKMLKVKPRLAYGKIEEILESAEVRQSVDCKVATKCGGCAFRHISYDAELKLKENTVKNNFKRIAKIELPFEPIVSGAVNRYRNKAQYPITVVGGKAEVGFFSNHSHRVVPCEDCLLQPEEFSKIAYAVKNFIKKFNISVYDEMTKKGLLRHLYIRKATKTGELMVCLVINGDNLPNCDELCQMLKAETEDITSIMLNINKKDTNVILGEKQKVLFGNDYITDILCGVKVKISPLSFYQVNHDVAEKLYKKAAEYAEPEGKTVVDLYCGAGTIGLSMAKKAKKIFGIEIVPEAVRDAKFNAKQNDITNAEFFCGDAKDGAKQLEKNGIKPEVIIVDPPRKGCSLELIETICNGFKPERVVYVSCDPATLARDCKIFADNGYECKAASTFDMFPRTCHVETAVCLTRK